MQETTSRRAFLKHTVLTSAAVAGATLAGTQPALAREPIQRASGHKFKFSLAAYSYRKLLSGSKPELTMFDFLSDCAAMNLDGAEPTSYFFPKNLTPEYLYKLKGDAFKNGLDISGTAIRNDFCHPAGKQRTAEINHVKKWTDYADMMDAPVIRVFGGHVKKGQTPDQAHKLMVEGFEEACDYAGKKGVFLALENHGGPTAEIDSLLRIVKDVNSPWFGLNLDSGNFHDDDPYGSLERMCPYALNVQIKVEIHSPKTGKMVESDYKRLAKMLRESGYRGYIVLEFESKGNPREQCPVYMEKLREAFV